MGTKKSLFQDTTLTKRKNNPKNIQRKDLRVIEDIFNRKFKSFGSKRSKERQRYRILFEKIKMFQAQFDMLKYRKNQYLLESEKKDIRMVYKEYAKCCLLGIYTTGKEIIDILCKLDLNTSISEENKKFINKFRETRNKIFEHGIEISEKLVNKTNYSKYSIVEVNYDELGNTDNIISVNFHGNKENKKIRYINYIKDYLELEKIIFNITNHKNF